MYKFNRIILEDAVRIQTALDELLYVELNMVPEDDVLDSTFIVHELRQCLCAAYDDQIISLNHDHQSFEYYYNSANTDLHSASPTLSYRMKNRSYIRAKGAATAAETAFLTVETDNDTSIDDDHHDGTEFEASFDSPSRKALLYERQSCLLLHQQSSLWRSTLIEVPHDSSQLAIFSKLGPSRNNGDRDGRAVVVQLVSFINYSDIAAIARMWQEEIPIALLLHNDEQEMICELFTISEMVKSMLLKSDGLMLNKFFHIPSKQCFAKLVLDHYSEDIAWSLQVTAPVQRMRYLRRKLDCLEESFSDQIFRLSVASLSEVNAKKAIAIIGRRSRNNNSDKITLLNRLNAMIRSARGYTDANEEETVALTDIWADKSSNEIVINLSGVAKQFASLVVGVTQSYIIERLDLRQVLLYQPKEGKGGALVSHGRRGNINLRLTTLSSAATPAVDINDRKSVMIYMAHAAIWTAAKGCVVYGGFVRDVVVRDENANDIDVGYDPKAISREQLRAFLLKAAQDIGIRFEKENASKGAAHALVFGNNGRWPSFDMDMVDLVQVVKVLAPPGVDCDVGNMVLGAGEAMEFGLKLKVKNNPKLLSLGQSLQHCQEKKFVFYYSGFGPYMPKAQARLQKYFERGWTCVSTLDEPLMFWATAGGYATLIQPKPEFLKRYYD